MKIKRYLISVLMAVVLAASASFGTGCATKKKLNPTPGPTQIELIRQQAERFIIYRDLALKGIDQISAIEALNSVPAIADALRTTRGILVEVKETGEPLLEMALTIAALDASNREQLKAAVDKILDKLKQLQPKVEALTSLVFAELNRRGKTNVDIESLPRDVGFAYTVLESAVRLIKTRL